MYLSDKSHDLAFARGISSCTTTEFAAVVQTLGLLLTHFLLLGVHAVAAVPQRSRRVLNYTKT